MGLRKLTNILAPVVLLAACLPLRGLAQLEVQVSVADGFLNGSTDGRLVVMFAPQGVDPLEDIDVTSSPNFIFGMNVYDLASSETVTLAGGSGAGTMTGVFGWPNVSLDEVPTGEYSVQAFLHGYEKATRSDGSVVSVHFPCGDGAPPVDAYGDLTTSIVDLNVTGGPQTIELILNNMTAVEAFTGMEIGGCFQGNYEDTENLKYVKIRSNAVSAFWGRDMYVGANVLLPAGYRQNDTSTRYPVIYDQGHWPADLGGFGYPEANFSDAWDAGVIPAMNGQPERPTPKLIVVTFRHETPFYDDSYAVNTANIGPYGDALNDELIPYIDATFNTIPLPYARVQVGGSTGGWESAASLIFRPDLFGVCFSSYPDSMSFYKHQEIPLYTDKNAYVRANGSNIPSIRDFENGTQVILATVAQENAWELTFGTSSRSSNQWDVWNAVFGIQGLNNYPLEPWDKVTGVIYPGAVEYWKHMDLTDYILSNWDNDRNLGEILKRRIFIYVGTWDDYFLNEGVIEFQNRVNGKGGPNWANITILPGEPHGGNYQLREIWNYIQLCYDWTQDHAPDGSTPLSSNLTTSASRGNYWNRVLEYGGHQAALARQAPPTLKAGDGGTYVATPGRWDPGVGLEAQWMVNGKPSGEPVAVAPGAKVMYTLGTSSKGSVLQLSVTGRKRYYVEETRVSNGVALGK